MYFMDILLIYYNIIEMGSYKQIILQVGTFSFALIVSFFLRFFFFFLFILLYFKQIHTFR